MKERISTRDVISLKCIRFYVDEIMMIYISTKKDVTQNSYNTKEQDIHKEVINIPIRYLLESIALG